MSVALAVLLVGLLLAGVSAAIGVAAAAVSQHELTRWVAYKLRGSAATVNVLKNPGQTLATSNMLTTLGVLLAAGAIPALLAATTPTFLGIFTITVGVPLFIGAAYLIPRVLGRRWAEPLVGHAVPLMERFGAVLSPFIPRREGSTRTTLAALLTGADTDALATTDEMAVVSGVLAFADRPVRELMTPRTAIVAFPEGILTAEAAHVLQQSGYSRYPVHRGSLDEVVGVAHTLDLLGRQPEDPILVRPPLTAPGTMRAADLMLEMTTELAEKLGMPLAGAQTVGGLLIQALGRIPRAGERFVYRGLEFDILTASATRVERIAVRAGPVRTIALGGGGGSA